MLSADVALLSESADVRLDTSACTLEAVVAAVEGCGFAARVVSSSPEGGGGSGAAAGVATLKLSVQGMHCSACSSAVEAALAAVPGVQAAAVSLTVQQAEVRYRAAVGGKALEAALVAAVEGAGFEAAGERRCGCQSWVLLQVVPWCVQPDRCSPTVAATLQRPIPAHSPALPAPCVPLQCWAPPSPASSCWRWAA